jgi:hypothetical protein
MASGQTVITYGNWQLRRCTTPDFHQQPVYDASGTDLLYYRYTVRVVGFIHGQMTSGGGDWCQLQSPFIYTDGVIPQIKSAALNHIGMRVELPPRQTLSVRMGADSTGTAGGYLALYAEPVPLTTPPPAGVTHLDCNNGPRCNSFRVIRVVSDNIFQVEAEFEACKVECAVDATAEPSSGTDLNTAGTAPNKTTGVLSNRWSCTDEVDATLRTVRVYDGELRVASINFDPSDFRYLVVPPLQPGLRREKILFSVAPDGLSLRYQIVDVEVVDSAPPPAKKWAVQHTESINEAFLASAECSVSLTADRNTNKADLIIIGMNVLITKLLGGNRAAGNTALVEALSVTDFIGDELTIAVSGRVRRMPQKIENAEIPDAFAPWFLGNAIIGKPLESTEVYSEPPSVFDQNYDGTRSHGGLEGNIAGSSPYYQGPVQLIGAFLPYLQSPCSDVHKIVQDYASLSYDANLTPNAGPLTTIAAAVDPGWTASSRPLFSASEISAMYTQWKMESVYRDFSGKAAMPVASSGYYGDLYDSIKVVTLSRPQCRRIVRVEAERVGAWPEMPSDAQLEALVGSTSSLVQTYLGKKRRFATPFYTAGGQKAYRVAVDFFFALNRTPAPGDTLHVGKTMWTTDGNITTTTTVTQGWA